MEKMLVGKGTRTATLSTVNCISTLNTHQKVLSKHLHVYYALVARHGSPATPRRAAAPAQQSSLSPRAAAYSQLAWTRATCHPALGTPRALVLPEVPEEQDHVPVKALAPCRLLR